MEFARSSGPGRCYAVHTFSRGLLCCGLSLRDTLRRDCPGGCCAVAGAFIISNAPAHAERGDNVRLRALAGGAYNANCAYSIDVLAKSPHHNEHFLRAIDELFSM